MKRSQINPEKLISTMHKLNSLERQIMHAREIEPHYNTHVCWGPKSSYSDSFPNAIQVPAKLVRQIVIDTLEEQIRVLCVEAGIEYDHNQGETL